MFVLQLRDIIGLSLVGIGLALAGILWVAVKIEDAVMKRRRRKAMRDGGGA